MTSRFRLRAAVARSVASLVLLAAPVAARANFVFISQSMTLDHALDRASFTLTFNQAPDFTKTDSFGRPANSFQIEFEGDTSNNNLTYPDDLTAILRGDEIHVANGLRIRKPFGNGGSNSGGWGPVVDTVPITLSNDSLHFTAPISALGIHDNHPFQYSVYSLQFGDLTRFEQVQFIPLRSALEMFPAGALVAAVVMWRMRQAKDRPTRLSGSDQGSQLD